MAAPTDIHRLMAEAWNNRNYDAMRALMHPGYTYTGGDGNETPGLEAGIGVAKMYAEAFPDGKLEVRKVYVQGDTAIAEMRATGTHRGPLMSIAPTGRSVNLAICNVMELRDDKIYREREYFDVSSILRQLGVTTLPGAAAEA